MGFNIVYGPSAAAVGQVGHEAGRGQYIQQVNARRQQERMQKTAIEAQQQTQQRQQEFQTQRDSEFEARQQRQAQFEQDLNDKGFELKITKQQEMENAKINQGVQYVNQQVSDGKWTQKEAQVALQQLEMRRAGLTRQPVLKQPSQYEPGKEPGKTWEQSGGLMTTDSKGNAKFLIPPPKFTMKEISDITQDVHAGLVKYKKGADGKEVEVLPSQAEVQAGVTQRIQSFLAANNAIIKGMMGDGSGQQGQGMQQQGQQGQMQPQQGPQPDWAQDEPQPKTNPREVRKYSSMLRDAFGPQRQFVDDGKGGYKMETTIPEGSAQDIARMEAAGSKDVRPELRSLDPKVVEQLKKNGTGKKGVKKVKPVNGGDWVGRVWDEDQAAAKVQFRDMNAAVISKAMAAMNDAGVPKAARTEVREVVQSLIGILKKADYEVPSSNPHQFYSRSMSKEGEAERVKAEKLSAYLVDFINNPAKFTGK